MELILAPLQGYTENAFRNAWSSVFTGLDYAVSPFIPLAAGSRFRMAHLRDVIPENNRGMRVVPQVLGNSPEKFVLLAQRLHDLGYTTVNWNLGCPKRTVAAKKRGSGLLPYPDLLRQILDEMIPLLPIQLSIKTRLGYYKPEEFYELIKVYNDYPLESLTIHPRTGIQEYEGDMHLHLLQDTIAEIQHEVIFSGDIMDTQSFDLIKKQFPGISRWMIGRGVIANPFLPQIIRTGAMEQADEIVRKKLILFHAELFNQLATNIEKEKSVLNKLKDFWSYFALWFADSHKIFYTIAHLETLESFRKESDRVMNENLLSPMEGRSNRQLKSNDFCS
jgi:tRNA-dihydrouridine synthase B